jgi:hypothetical protein
MRNAEAALTGKVPRPAGSFPQALKPALDPIGGGNPSSDASSAKKIFTAANRGNGEKIRTARYLTQNLNPNKFQWLRKMMNMTAAITTSV